MSIGLSTTAMGLSLAGATTASPAKQMQALTTAGLSESSVKWSANGAIGPVKLVIVTFASVNDGSQNITYVLNGIAHHVTVRLLGATAYVKGDSVALSNYMGYKALDAKKYANQWIAVKKGNPDFPAVASGLTVRSVIDELKFAGTILAMPSQVVNGVKVNVLKGSTVSSSSAPAMHQVLYVNPASNLPVKVVLTFHGAVQSVDFTSWGERATVTAPPTSVTFSTSWLKTG